MRYPVVLSRYVYVKNDRGGITCDNGSYLLPATPKLGKIQGFHGSKLLCSAFVYFTPKPCNIWATSIDKGGKLIPPPGPLSGSFSCSPSSRRVCNLRSRNYIVIVGKRSTLRQYFSSNLFSSRDNGLTTLVTKIPKLFFLFWKKVIYILFLRHICSYLHSTGGLFGNLEKQKYDPNCAENGAKILFCSKNWKN